MRVGMRVGMCVPFRNGRALAVRIWAMRANEVSAANACFLLQFCSCYLFFCYYHAESQNTVDQSQNTVEP